MLADSAFDGPTVEQYRGDLQMHSEWSDGTPTVDEIADAMSQAAEMPEEERRKRMHKMRAVVAEHNVFRWAGKLLSALVKFEFPENSIPEFELTLSGR